MPSRISSQVDYVRAAGGKRVEVGDVLEGGAVLLEQGHVALAEGRLAEDVYTAEECAAFVERIEAGQPTLATKNSPYRDQDRVIFGDPAAAEDLFRRLEAHLPRKIDQPRLRSDLCPGEEPPQEKGA